MLENTGEQGCECDGKGHWCMLHNCAVGTGLYSIIFGEERKQEPEARRFDEEMRERLFGEEKAK